MHGDNSEDETQRAVEPLPATGRRRHALLPRMPFVLIACLPLVLCGAYFVSFIASLALIVAAWLTSKRGNNSEDEAQCAVELSLATERRRYVLLPRIPFLVIAFLSLVLCGVHFVLPRIASLALAVAAWLVLNVIPSSLAGLVYELRRGGEGNSPAGVAAAWSAAIRVSLGAAYSPSFVFIPLGKDVVLFVLCSLSFVLGLLLSMGLRFAFAVRRRAPLAS